MTSYVFFGNPFLLLILKENDISYTSRRVSGPALHSSNSPFLLLLGSNQNLSFYLVIFASSTSFILDLRSPTLLLPLSCSIQFEFYPQHFLPRVGLPPGSLPACGFGVFTGHTTPTLGPQGGLCVLTHRRILQRPLCLLFCPEHRGGLEFCSQGCRALSSSCLDADNRQVW